MIPPTLFPTWLAHIPLQPTWTGWHTMQALTQHTGYWNP